ncbi:MAG TPA: hypothetical protein VHY91_04075 [Pirellulales bacterium]|jgi:hypothetical protein|nr:hypothetical protein [Pirellulales bacterium]
MKHALETPKRILRRGITLLEVLISMFVALVGLAGLASLFWLGGIEMSEGVKFDRALAVGRAAQRSFKILGMHRPIQSGTYVDASGNTLTGLMQTWVVPDYNTGPNFTLLIDSSFPGGTVAATSTTAAGAAIAPTMPFAGAPPNYYNTSSNGGGFFGVGNYTQGFAIDPIGVIANSTNYPGFPPLDATGATIYFPPISTSAAPCLIRTTLMAYPALPTKSQTTPTLWSAGATGAGLTYSAGQADLVFRSQDDLILNPPNGDYPPTQLYTSAGRRQSQGDYSWLATVTPGFSTYQSDMTIPKLPIDTPIGDTNLVRVSIVVFYKRNPNVLQADVTGQTAPSERMVTVATTLAANAHPLTNPAPIGPDGTTATGTLPTGVAGGDIQLTTSLDTTMNQNYLTLKPGQWIMLSQAPAPLAYNTSLPAPPPNIFMSSTYWYRWYKVVAAGPIQGGAGNYYRNVTLSGPDWNPNNTTYASIFDGAVAVYEKEMELEQSGAPFSPN